MSKAVPTQIDREEFLARLRAGLPAKSEEEADDAVEGIRWRIGKPEGIERLKQVLEAFLLDPDTGHVGIVEIYDVAHIRAALNRPGFDVCNWHYDRTARALLLNLRRGVHESLAGALQNVYTGKPSWLGTAESAEQYVIDGRGWFMSTVSRRPLKGPLVVLDAQERMAFRDVEFRALT